MIFISVLIPFRFPTNMIYLINKWYSNRMYSDIHQDDIFLCITILYKNVKTLSLRSTQSPHGANSIKIPLIYVHVISDLSLTIIKLSYYVKNVSPCWWASDRIPYIYTSFLVRSFTFLMYRQHINHIWRSRIFLCNRDYSCSLIELAHAVLPYTLRICVYRRCVKSMARQEILLLEQPRILRIWKKINLMTFD